MTRSPLVQRISSLLWHMPGRAWVGALKAANITLWWRFGAALVVSTLIAWLIYIFWRGGFWPAEAWRIRADWLGYSLMWAWFALIICIVAIMDFRLNFRASKSGIEANMAGDEHDHIDAVSREATTTASVGDPRPGPSPAAPPAAAPSKAERE